MAHDNFCSLTDENWKVTAEKRNKFFEENKTTEENVVLYAYTVTPEWYEQMVKRYIEQEK